MIMSSKLSVREIQFFDNIFIYFTVHYNELFEFFDEYSSQFDANLPFQNANTSEMIRWNFKRSSVLESHTRHLSKQFL